MNPKTTFFEKGYVVAKGLIPHHLIDSCLNALAQFKSSNALFFSQSTHQWLRANKQIDGNGLLRHSVQNFTDIPWFPPLSRAGNQILLSHIVEDYLQKLAPADPYCLWQNMLFDKSTGTLDHFDSWYLDTDPLGHVIAAWFALEDITPEGGSFHVYPGSHKSLPLSWNVSDHSEFASLCHRQSANFKKESMYLKKGDVLFWHPFLLHGSSHQTANGFSRKSLTAHYHPLSLRRTSRAQTIVPSSVRYRQEVQQTARKLRKIGTYPIYSKKNRYRLAESISYPVKAYLKRLNAPFWQMDRSNYQ